MVETVLGLVGQHFLRVFEKAPILSVLRECSHNGFITVC
jgi:hypothetical protein